MAPIPLSSTRQPSTPSWTGCGPRASLPRSWSIPMPGPTCIGGSGCPSPTGWATPRPLWNPRPSGTRSWRKPSGSWRRQAPRRTFSRLPTGRLPEAAERQSPLRPCPSAGKRGVTSLPNGSLPGGAALLGDGRGGSRSRDRPGPGVSLTSRTAQPLGWKVLWTSRRYSLSTCV
jgi:hypothetical protein